MWSGSNGTSEPSQTKSENQSLVKEEGRLRDHDGMDQSILNRSGGILYNGSIGGSTPEQIREANAMVADDERRRKFLLLDQQLLNNDETVGGRKTYRLDEWTGLQIFDLWLWAHRLCKTEQPPHRLVPNGHRSI